MNPDLLAFITASSFAEVLFDRIPDVVFFIKDREGRYVVVNQTLVERCGRRDKDELLGHTARDVFPTPLGDRFFEQDRRVLASGVPIAQNLELHLYPTRHEGWCLTDKLPLLGTDNQVTGIAGISRDLQTPGVEAAHLAEVTTALEHVRAHYGSELRVEQLAEIAGLSVYQLNRRLRAVFGITAGQLITKSRIDVASELLRVGTLPIAEIAYACGYFDQSAFSRVFRRTVGLTPRQYRARHQTRV
jgi:transcriptional regulator GlxA family with amidase domain